MPLLPACSLLLCLALTPLPTPLPDGALARMHAGPVFTLALAPDGKTLASGHEDGSVRLWEPRTGKALGVLQGGRGSIKALVFTPDGKRLVSAGADEAIRIWDVASGRALRTLTGPPGGTLTLALSRDGKVLASAGNDPAVLLWDLVRGEVRGRLAGHAGIVYSLAFAPNGKTLASGGRDRTVRLWDVATGKERRRWSTPGWVYCLSYAGNGKLLAAAGRDQTIHFWIVASGAQLDPAGGYEGPVAAVALDAAGVTVFGATEDHKVRRWGTQSAKVLRRLDGHRGAVRALALAPDESFLASAAADGSIVVWDLDGPESLWLELGLHDDAHVGQVVARLAAAPRVVAFLRQRMAPILERAFRVDRLIGELDGSSYAVRARASRELEGLGELAESALRKALGEKASLERQRRIGRILTRLPAVDTGEIQYSARLRLGRALQVLERIGTPEARQVLQDVARGPPGARLVQEAQAALDRLARRTEKR